MLLKVAQEPEIWHRTEDLRLLEQPSPGAS